MATVQIPMRNGGFALINEEDVALVLPYRWYARIGAANSLTQYAVSTFRIPGGKGKRGGIYMHRLIMSAAPGTRIDHANRNGLDNRRENLRFCTQSQNVTNRIYKSNKSSGFRGVQFNKNNNKYRVWVTVKGKHIHGGYYRDPAEAARVYDKMALEIFGEFAVLNFSLSGCRDVSEESATVLGRVET